ncbi:MAG TPA: biotin/lipoate A/B protein ligase family protein [Chloroflexia bacterium]|nr:biotin/lipoate A/B protein ligase family protein [Chloroflexia bacterium]
MTVTADNISTIDIAGRQPVAEWRMLADYNMAGDYHMALDEVLLDAIIDGGAPVVRFYTWRPATLSLGVNQHVGEIDPAECEARGIGIVRRLTGGRAVLHQHELTYSVIARDNDPRVSGGVIESYRKISAALVAGLKSLGVDVSLAAPNKALFRAMSASRRVSDLELSESGVDPQAASTNGAICFDVSSAYELEASGRKLVGSAQARRGGAILQHGSILLDIDWDSWVSVFSYATEAGKQRARLKLPSRMTSLRHELGRIVTPQEVQAALINGFEQTFNIALNNTSLSAQEQAETARLVSEKYSAGSWITKT